MWRKLLLIGLVLSFAFSSVLAADVNQMTATEKALAKYDVGQALTPNEKMLIEDEVAWRESIAHTRQLAETRENHTTSSGLRSALSEGFEGSFPPAGWSMINTSSSNDVTQNSDQANSGTYSARFSSFSSSSSGYIQYMISPELEVTTGDNSFSFWYRKYSSGSEIFSVGVSTTDNDPASFTFGSDVTDASTTWQQHTVDLSAHDGVNIFVAIKYSSNYAYYLYIDDVVGPEVYVAPVPPAAAIEPLPTDAATGVALSQVMTWAASFGATGYDLSFGTDNPPTNVLDAADQGDVLAYTPTLAFSTTYYWTVTPYNAYGDATDAVVWSFTTMDDPTIASFPHTEGFEDGEPGWISLDNNSDGDAWNMNYTSNPHSGSESANISTDYNAGANDDYLISAPIALTGGQRMIYWYRAQSSFEPNDFQVLLSTTGTDPADFTTTLLPLAEYDNTTYMSEIIDLSAYTGTVYIAFHVPAGGLDGYKMYIDDVTIEDIPIVPVVSLSEESIDFGQLVEGGSASFDILISNPGGGADMVVTDLTVTAPFSATYSGTIAIDTSAMVTVYFDPTVAGDFTGTLTVNVDGGFLGTNTMDLMGMAYPDDYIMEDFESGALAYGWEVLSGTGADWSVYSSTYSAYEGMYSLKGPYNSSGGDSWVLLPELRLTTGDFVSFMLDGSSTSNTDLEVYVSTAGNTIADFTVLLDSYVGGVNQPADYELIVVDLSAYENMDVYVALRVLSDAGYTNIYVDNLLMPPGAPNANTPFFSEYMEGSSNNKGLEIYNLTGATLNLDEYQIAQSSNGGGWAYYHVFPAGATLDHESVWLIANDGLFQEVIDIADEVLPYPSVVHHNGNDARALVHIVGTDTTIVDVIGVPDEDINWDVAGVSQATKDHNLVRKPEVFTGNTDWLLSAGTHADTSEWIVYETNYWYGMGYHNEPYPTPGTVCEMALPYGAVGDLAIDGVIEAGDVYWYSFTTDGTYDYTNLTLWFRF